MGAFPIFPSRRIRTTPFTERVEASKLSSYTVYNHMLLPTSFASLEEDCAHLKKHVQIWDVSGQRQVQISGPDAHELVMKLSARDISHAKPGKCYYAPITDGRGMMLNDPVILCLDKDKYWLSIADSDIALWAAGIAEGLQMKVDIYEPDISPLAIQGPKSNDVMAELFGDEIRSLKFFNFGYYNWRGHDLVIGRSGFSKQGGFEIYLHDTALGTILWDDLWEIGKDHEMRAGCPSIIERIEGGLLSYGNDMTRNDTPLECGLENYVNLESDHDFIGKSALKNQAAEGIKKHLVGVKFSGSPITPLSNTLACRQDNREVGKVTSGCYSPDFESNLGIAMLDKSISASNEPIDILIGDEWRKAETAPIPFA